MLALKLGTLETPAVPCVRGNCVLKVVNRLSWKNVRIFPLDTVQIPVYSVSQESICLQCLTLPFAMGMRPQKSVSIRHVCCCCQVPTTGASCWLHEGTGSLFSIKAERVIPGLMLRCRLLGFPTSWDISSSESLKFWLQLPQ